MDKVIEITLTYLLPVFLAIGAGFASGKFGKKLKTNEIIADDKEKIKQIIDEMCPECQFRKKAEKTVNVEKQMAIAMRILMKVHTTMKGEFLRYAKEKKYAEKKDLLNMNTYALFENTIDSAKEDALDDLRGQFTRNNIDALSGYEIESRAELLWNLITQAFDAFYKTNEYPSRIELYELFDAKKDRLINTLETIYEEVKNLKDNT